MSNSSIWPIDRTLSNATTPSQSVPGSDGNDRVLCIPQSSSINETSPSDCLVSYLGHSLGRESDPSVEMQSVYSAASAVWVKSFWSFVSISNTFGGRFTIHISCVIHKNVQLIGILCSSGFSLPLNFQSDINSLISGQMRMPFNFVSFF